MAKTMNVVKLSSGIIGVTVVLTWFVILLTNGGLDLVASMALVLIPTFVVVGIFLLWIKRSKIILNDFDGYRIKKE